MPWTIYSIGYEKKSIEEYIEKLKRENISILLDVRENAWSYKQSFRKNTLNASLKDAGIDYFHIRAAGNPKAIRKNFVRPKTVLKKYKLYLQQTQSGLVEITEFISIAKKANKKICLTCYEKNHKDCHRSVILDEIKKDKRHVYIKHL